MRGSFLLLLAVAAGLAARPRLQVDALERALRSVPLWSPVLYGNESLAAFLQAPSSASCSYRVVLFFLSHSRHAASRVSSFMRLASRFSSSCAALAFRACDASSLPSSSSASLLGLPARPGALAFSSCSPSSAARLSSLSPASLSQALSLLSPPSRAPPPRAPPLDLLSSRSLPSPCLLLFPSSPSCPPSLPPSILALPLLCCPPSSPSSLHLLSLLNATPSSHSPPGLLLHYPSLKPFAPVSLALSSSSPAAPLPPSPVSSLLSLWESPPLLPSSVLLYQPGVGVDMLMLSLVRGLPLSLRVRVGVGDLLHYSSFLPSFLPALLLIDSNRTLAYRGPLRRPLLRRFLLSPAPNH